MSRQYRIHYRNAFYHVMLRGNNHQNIFHQHDDYHHFLSGMKNAANLYDARCHLYCLMTNHIHLVIEVIDVPISKIMQSISTKYAKKHNKLYGKVGHLFQGRFKSKLIHDDRYLLELCYYIHMNPVKANMCKSPDDYPWSSHHAYVRVKSNSITSIEHISAMLGDLGISYKQFIVNYKNDAINPNYCVLDNDGALTIKNSKDENKLKKPMLFLDHAPLRLIINIVCDYLNVNSGDLSSNSRARKVVFARTMVAYFAHYHAKFTLNDIAAFFCLQRTSLSKTMHKYLKLAKTDKQYTKIINALEYKLSIVNVGRV